MIQRFIKKSSDFELIRGVASTVFDLRQRIPGRICRLPCAISCLFDYDQVTAGSFWPMLRSLALLHDEREIQISVVEPDPVEYFHREFGLYSAFRLGMDATSDEYWDALAEGPPGWEADALRYRADVWVAVGPSKNWGLWNDRDTGISVAYSIPTVGLRQWEEDASDLILTTDEAEQLIAQGRGQETPGKEFVAAFRKNVVSAATLSQ